MRKLPGNRSGYLPSLDGWRAIAILAVVAAHDTPYTWHGRSFRSLQDYGSLGVVLFFAISGILISGRILEEESLTGRFHLKLFYIRRFFRIQPPALVYLGVIAMLALAGALQISWWQWLAGLLMFENFTYHARIEIWRLDWFTGHFWTLAVEEHFYLLVSLALYFVRRHRLRIFAVGLVCLKTAQFVIQHHIPDPQLRRTYWQIQTLLWPTIFAIALTRPAIRSWCERWMQAVPVLAVTIVLAAVAYRRSPNLMLNVLEYSFTLWVISTMLHPRSWPTRLLEWRPIRFLGRISYSFYLWHILFFSANSIDPVHARLLLAVSGRPAKYVCSLLAAVASYYLIEKPCIRLGHRLAPPATAGHRDLASQPTLTEKRSRALAT